MNRILFIISLVLLLIFGLYLIRNNTRGYAFIVLVIGSIITFARRINLGLKPWWGGKLTDIPKYFKLP